MRFRLRTLLIVLALGPPILSWGILAILSLHSIPAMYVPALDFTSHVTDNQSYMTTAAVRDGKVVVEKRSYGPVKAGDEIRLGPGDHVFVNRQRRWPE